MLVMRLSLVRRYCYLFLPIIVMLLSAGCTENPLSLQDENDAQKNNVSVLTTAAGTVSSEWKTDIDLRDLAPRATWKNKDERIPWNTSWNNQTRQGACKLLEDVILENGDTAVQVLYTRPQAKDGKRNGYIYGDFKLTIPPASKSPRIHTHIGFLESANRTDGAKFRIHLYSYKEKKWFTIAHANKEYNGSMKTLWCDLWPWGGQEVKIRLSVFSLKGDKEDRAVWVRPSIQTNNLLYKTRGAPVQTALSCYGEDTKVHTKRGLIPIKSVKVGDYVMSIRIAQANHYWEWKEVKSIFQGGASTLVRYHLNDGTTFSSTVESNIPVKMKNGRPIWTPGFLIPKRFPNHHLISRTRDNGRIIVKNAMNINRVTFLDAKTYYQEKGINRSAFTVYSLTVKDNRNFCIGSNGVVVHNGTHAIAAHANVGTSYSIPGFGSIAGSYSADGLYKVEGTGAVFAGIKAGVYGSYNASDKKVCLGGVASFGEGIKASTYVGVCTGKGYSFDTDKMTIEASAHVGTAVGNGGGGVGINGQMTMAEIGQAISSWFGGTTGVSSSAPSRVMPTTTTDSDQDNDGYSQDDHYDDFIDNDHDGRPDPVTGPMPRPASLY